MYPRQSLDQLPQITFTLDHHELVTGNLLPGCPCVLRYDPLRLLSPEDPDHLQAVSTMPVTAYVRFSPLGPIYSFDLQSRTGRLRHPDVDITGQGTMQTGQFDIPTDAEEVIVWFSVRMPDGSIQWDSAYGANFHFRFTSRDLAVLRTTVTNDQQIPYSRFAVEVAADPAITSITARYRVVNDRTGDSRRSEVPLSPTGAADEQGRKIWSVSGIAVPHRAVVAFDLVYVAGGHRFTDDNEGRYFLAPMPSPPQATS
jgi:hypothetical protein